MRGTAFHERTKSLNVSTAWFGWGEYIIPDIYSNLERELLAIRSAVAAIDMSPLPKLDIHGKDALSLVNSLVTRDLTKQKQGQAVFTPLCNDAGKLICDGLVFLLDQNHLRVVSDENFEWFQMNAGSLDVSITNTTHLYGVLSLQGPRSKSVLEAVCDRPIEAFNFSSIRHSTIADVQVMVVRQGFTGEHGYELWVDVEKGPAVWDAVMASGGDFGIEPAGEYAVDVARVESGFVLISADYTGAGPDRQSSNIIVDDSHQASPYEMGFGKFVDLTKSYFIGRDSLLEEHNAGETDRAIVGLVFESESLREIYRSTEANPNISSRVRWTPLSVVENGQPVGRATSVTWSPTLKRVIGFGVLPRGMTEQGRDVSIEWTDDSGKYLGAVFAKIVDLPFVEIRRKTL
ncbi:MAG TPA: aminomethyl transferase family protein [Gammaproteobacteria bacterium]|nr:aminomethyl transferase family protein [Gammaproteobacteria bacterium]